jgi:glycerate dehydrogenase
MARPPEPALIADRGVGMQGVFLDADSVTTGDLDLGELEKVLPEWHSYPATAPEQVHARIAEAAVVVSNKVMLDEAALARAPHLRLVCVAATGTNNVDLEAARRRAIAVSNVRAYAGPAVAQHVFALVLALATRLREYDQAVREGRWQRSTRFCLLDYPIRELAGKNLGIIGYGDLGRGVAQIGEAFGMQVLVAQRPGGAAQPGRLLLEELLREVDVLSIHAPLTPATQGLIGARELALMKRDALLINTARGGIVDEQALADALRAGRLGGAGIDVLTREPPVEGNPLLAPDIPNLIVTPHTAWATREARQRVVDQVVANIRAFLAGEPRNLVV